MLHEEARHEERSRISLSLSTCNYRWFHIVKHRSLKARLVAHGGQVLNHQSISDASPSRHFVVGSSGSSHHK